MTETMRPPAAEGATGAAALAPDAAQGAGQGTEPNAGPGTGPGTGQVAKAVPRWAVIGIFLLLAMEAITVAQAFLMPVVLGLLLTLVFSPVRRWLERRGLNVGVAAGLIVLTLVAVFLAIALALAAPVAGLMDDGPRIVTQVETKLAELRGAAESVREVADQVDAIASGEIGGEEEEAAPLPPVPAPVPVPAGGTGSAEDSAAAAATAASQAAVAATVAAEAAAEADDAPQTVVVQDQSTAAALALSAPAILGQVAFTLVLLFFMLASGDMFYEKVVHVIPRFSDKKRAIQIAYAIERRLSQYLLTITAINAGLGCAIGLAMWAIGMPTPLLFAVVGFVFNFVPYVGAIAGVVIAAAVGLITFPEVGGALLAGGLYLALTTIEGQFVTPYLVGRNLRLNTVVVFLSVTLWAWLWSVVGMLVATPVLVAMRTIFENIPAMEPLGDFLSARGDEREDPPEPPKEAPGAPPGEPDPDIDRALPDGRPAATAAG